MHCNYLWEYLPLVRPRLRVNGCAGPAAGDVSRQQSQPVRGVLPADGAETAGMHGTGPTAQGHALGEAHNTNKVHDLSSQITDKLWKKIMFHPDARYFSKLNNYLFMTKQLLSIQYPVSCPYLYCLFQSALRGLSYFANTVRLLPFILRMPSLFTAALIITVS